MKSRKSILAHLCITWWKRWTPQGGGSTWLRQDSVQSEVGPVPVRPFWGWWLRLSPWLTWTGQTPPLLWWGSQGRRGHRRLRWQLQHRSWRISRGSAPDAALRRSLNKKATLVWWSSSGKMNKQAVVVQFMSARSSCTTKKWQKSFFFSTACLWCPHTRTCFDLPVAVDAVLRPLSRHATPMKMELDEFVIVAFLTGRSITTNRHSANRSAVHLVRWPFNCEWIRN